MYLKLNSKLELKALGLLLVPGSAEEAFNWDYENVYEWMYVDIPDFDFSLNVSREHGLADIDDNLLDEIEARNEDVSQYLKPGPTYIFGWNSKSDAYVEELPDTLIQLIANRLNMEVVVFNKTINVDEADPEPFAVVKPG